MSSNSRFQKQLNSLKEFYETEFSLKSALEVMGIASFSKREFGFQVAQNNQIKFIRNISFATPEIFMDYIQQKIPLAMYVGAIYSEGPNYRQQKSIQRLKWIKRELIFDLDLTDYDSIRPCDCKSKNMMCNRCWPLINTSIMWIHETLKEDFGIKDITWVFSGRRGVHAWIGDQDFSLLDSDQRAAIVDYLTFFKGDGNTAKFSPIAKYNPKYLERVNRLLYETYFTDISKDQLIDLGFSDNRAGFILDKLYQTGISKDFLSKYIFVKNKVLNIAPKQSLPSNEDIRDKILLKWSPRIDTAVTIDVRRILRLPGSIHGESGKIVRFIDEDDLDIFDPFEEESIY